VLRSVLDGGLDTAQSVTVLQLSDTHLSGRHGLPASMAWLLAEAAADPPDLVALTGDLVYEDPDDAADRRFAMDAFGGLPCPFVAIPGNHDVGFYGEDAARPARVEAFVEAWGGDRFSLDAAGWRLVGADSYLLGTAEHDGWLRAAVQPGDGRPVAVFMHQPVADPNDDGWQITPDATAAFEAAIADAGVRLIASGHRHRYVDRGRDVWAPSTTIPGQHSDAAGGDPRLGALRFTFHRDGTHTHRHVPCP
jgi:3',5'-cyclic AMP phosphodiesterase CpdA